MSDGNNRLGTPRLTGAFTDTDAGDGDTDRFTNSAIDRRTFVRLSAATGAALALPGAATADVSGEAMTDEYEFVANHIPDEYEASTVIEFATRDALETFADEYVTAPDPGRPRPPKAVVRESPAPAAHARSQDCRQGV